MSSVTPDRWRALSPYLDEALDLEGEARAAWLASLAARDAMLAADLRSLLDDHDAANDAGFLERGVPNDLRPAPAEALAGLIVGTYRLVSLIGQGGMGSVWLAERCDGRFEGRAAVKLLNLGLMGRAIEGRFRREGHILAKVTHPHIAHLIDAGVTEAGQPYLVLELVEGEHIDRYCNQQALPLRSRIRLFLQVLEAVAHAHANLIVHRDIKPTNVLVRSDGQVKLLDFGIAKLLEGETAGAGGTSALTREAGAALTPEFAAPEQLSHGQVTTATDIYALGVVLHVLLTGEHPFAAALDSPASLVRAIIEDEPRRMSEVVATRLADPAGEAQHLEPFGTSPARLRRELRGDLDTIVAKALKKSPAERYGSVTELAEDLRRYLRREPIAARPDTWRYRAGKFVRRHVRAIAATASVIVLLAVVIGFYTMRLAAERDRAQREAARATKVSEVLTGLLTSADPISNRATREGLTVRGLLDRGVDQAEQALADEPEAASEIFAVLGRLYRQFGVYDKAERLLERALVSADTAFGPEHLRQAQILNELGAVLTDRGDYAAAERSLQQALDIRRNLLGTDHADVAVTMVELGRFYQDRGLNDRAEPLKREALEIRRRVLGEGDRETAVSLSDLASELRLRGDLDGAEALLRQGLEINRKTRGERHPNTGSTLHDLGLIAVARHDYAAAEALFLEALDIHRQTLGPNHPNVAIGLNSLAHVRVAQGRYDAAAEALAQALEIARPALGADHQLVAIYSVNLAVVQLARQRPREAEPLLEEGLRIRSIAPELIPLRRRTLPDDDWSITAIQRLLDEAKRKK